MQDQLTQVVHGYTARHDEDGRAGDTHPDVQFIEVLGAHPVSQFFCVCGWSTAVFFEHILHGFQPL